MDDLEIIRNAETSPDLQNPIQKYHIVFHEQPGWACSGTRKRWSGQSKRFPFLNSDTFFAQELNSAVQGRDTITTLESSIYLGTAPAPELVKGWSYLGERMNDRQFKLHLARHEVGHQAVGHDLAVVLQRLTPGKELEFLQTMSQVASGSRRDGSFPLSMLYKHGAIYTTDEKRFIEDLAEMYAVRTRSFVEGNHVWQRYKNLAVQSNPQLEFLFIVMEELFKESQKLQY